MNRMRGRRLVAVSVIAYELNEMSKMEKLEIAEELKRVELYADCLLPPSKRGMIKSMWQKNPHELSREERCELASVYNLFLEGGMLTSKKIEESLPFENDPNPPQIGYSDSTDLLFTTRYMWPVLVLRGGFLCGFNPIRLWREYEWKRSISGQGSWKCDDVQVIVHFELNLNEWYEVHPRRDIPKIVESFKEGVRRDLKDLAIEGGDWPKQEDFPLRMQICLEVYNPNPDVFRLVMGFDDRRTAEQWEGLAMLEVLPITQNENGFLSRSSPNAQVPDFRHFRWERRVPEGGYKNHHQGDSAS